MLTWLFLVGVPLLLIAPAWVLGARRRRRGLTLGAVFLGMVLGAVLGWLCLPILMVGASGQLDIGFGIACVLLAILGSVVGAWSGLGVSALLDRRRVAD